MNAPLVIVGNGMAAARLCEEIAGLAPVRPGVTVIGAEPGLAYNRVLLSDVLGGKVALAEIEMKPAGWWEAAGIDLICGTAVTAINRHDRTVSLADGRRLPYGRLVLATGSEPIRLPIPGADLNGVTTFRDLSDVRTLMACARPGVRAVVIGGGLLGIEAATGLATAGAHTTLVHVMDRLMERQLDARAAALLRQAVEAQGVHVELEAQSVAIEGEAAATGLRLADGRLLPADIVVMACGVRPSTTLARAAGLKVGRGIAVDDTLATSDPDIFALGECAEHRGACYGIVAPAYEQARILARRLTGQSALYEGSVVATNLKVSGVFVYSAGDIGPGGEDIVFSDRGLGLYRRLVIRDGRLSGAVLYGDTSDGPFYLDLITNRTPIAALRANLAFGRLALDAA